MTTEGIKNIEPFEVYVENTSEIGIDRPSKLQFNYPRTVDKKRLTKYLGIANREIMISAKKAWKTAFCTDEW